jgi:hypothetical protein
MAGNVIREIGKERHVSRRGASSSRQIASSTFELRTMLEQFYGKYLFL